MNKEHELLCTIARLRDERKALIEYIWRNREPRWNTIEAWRRIPAYIRDASLNGRIDELDPDMEDIK